MMVRNTALGLLLGLGLSIQVAQVEAAASFSSGLSSSALAAAVQNAVRSNESNTSIATALRSAGYNALSVTKALMTIPGVDKKALAATYAQSLLSSAQTPEAQQAALAQVQTDLGDSVSAADLQVALYIAATNAGMDTATATAAVATATGVSISDVSSTVAANQTYISNSATTLAGLAATAAGAVQQAIFAPAPAPQISQNQGSNSDNEATGTTATTQAGG